MPRYRVKGTDLWHNGTHYPEGSLLALSEAEAAPLARLLELLPPRATTLEAAATAEISIKGKAGGAPASPRGQRRTK